MTDADPVEGWPDKPANLDVFLQGKLNKEMPHGEGNWGRRYAFDEYHGSLRYPIWEAFGHLYDTVGGPTATVHIATTERDREIDFRLETFAAATGLDRQQRSKDWIFMGSAQQLRLLDSRETHAERKILAAMRPAQNPGLKIGQEAIDAVFHRQFGEPIRDPKRTEPKKKTLNQLSRQRRWLGAFLGGWTETLFIFVTRSPCGECSEALVHALGEEEQHHFGRLIVAFCTFYKGGHGDNALPCRDFFRATQGVRPGIELYKVHWNGTTEDFISSRETLRETYFDPASSQHRTAHPVALNGLPSDPRYCIYRLVPT